MLIDTLPVETMLAPITLFFPSSVRTTNCSLSVPPMMARTTVSASALEDMRLTVLATALSRTKLIVYLGMR